MLLFSPRNAGSFWLLSATTLLPLLSHCAATDIEPVSVSFGPDFLGDDGQWSVAQVRVGSPQQWLLVFPSTIDSETWVVGPSGCDSSLTCQTLRGGLFSADQSTSWQALGNFELGYSALSQTTSYGYYGLDDLSLSNDITIPSQVVAVVNDTWSWDGRLGLNPQETRFQTNVDHMSFISTLVQNESLIPSHSYGYTAGAFYESKGVLGSLTLGGVDSTRYVPNDVSFSLSTGYKPIVAITSLTVEANPSSQSVLDEWGSNPLNLMPQNEAALFTVDSSTSFLWLPEAVCDNFAKALDLTYNDTLELYMFANNSTPQSLAGLNLTFNFTFADLPTSTNTISLTVSYDAFNQQLSYPFAGLFSNYSDSKVNYFPLRRANSTTQYTIGRVLLQELYLTVDYERNNFSLSQALFPDTSTQSPMLTAITRPSNSSWPGPGADSSSGSHLSVGAKAGIGVAVALTAAVIIAAVIAYFIRRRRRNGPTDDSRLAKAGLFRRFVRSSTKESGSSTAELAADKYHPTEMVADASASRFELAGVAPVEMPGAEVPPSFFAPQRDGQTILQRNDRRSPAELVQPSGRHAARQSIAKDDIDVYITRSDPEHAQETAPAYSLRDEHNQAGDSQTSTQQSGNSASISPYEMRAGTNALTTRSSDIGVSPISGSGSERDHPSATNMYSRRASDLQHLLSPVSPVATVQASETLTSDQPTTQSAGAGVESEARRSTSGTSPDQVEQEAPFRSASPRVPSRPRVPRRTDSSTSKFKEDLPETSTLPDTQTPTEDAANSSASPQAHSRAYSRFSWED